MLFDRSIRDMLSQSEADSGAILFSPLNFTRQDLPTSLVSCQLDPQTLMHFGKLASRAKDRFTASIKRLEAKATSHDAVREGDHSIDIPVLRRGYNRKREQKAMDKLIIAAPEPDVL